MRRVHLQVWVGVFSYQQMLTKISFVIIDTVGEKQIECRLAWHWWNSTDLGLCINWHVFLPIKIVACILLFSEIALQTKFGKYLQIWFFSPIWGEKMAAFWACACKLSWTLLFARPGSAPIWGGTKGEFRVWTSKSRAGVSQAWTYYSKVAFNNWLLETVWAFNMFWSI